MPDVAALGPVPQALADVEAYLARLATVSRALNLAHAAYATALEEREVLRGQLEAYAVKAARVDNTADGSPGASDDLGEIFRRAQEVLRAEPADMARARALVSAHQAYLFSRSTPTGPRKVTTNVTTRGTT